MDVYYMDVNSEVYDYNYQFYFNKVSYLKKAYIDDLRFYKDKKETLYGEIMVKLLLINKYKLKPDEMFFRVNPNGKKYINHRSDIFFNLSHSNNNIVCCIDKKEVGIDIEVIKSVKLSIAKRFFTENEINYLTKVDKSNINEYFLKMFTRKEAYAKAYGLKLFDVLSTYDTINELKGEDEKYCIYSCKYNNNVISICKLNAYFDEVINFYEVRINYKKEIILNEKHKRDLIFI